VAAEWDEQTDGRAAAMRAVSVTMACIN